MKRVFFLVAVICLVQMVFGQSYRLEQNDYQKVAITFIPGEISVQDISVPEGDFSMIAFPDYGSSYDPGAPQLPQLSRMMEIPICDSVNIHIVNAEYVDFHANELGINHPLFPVQISSAKSDPIPNFVYNRDIYRTDAFYSLPLVSVEKGGVMRSSVLATVHVSPVQYNPVSQIVRIYNRIEVEFTFANADIAQTFELKKYSSPFFDLDKGLVINQMNNTRNEYLGTPIKYLIIGNSMFENNEDLNAFVEWKKRLGYMVELVFTNTSQLGNTTTAIQNYIQSQFNNATETDPAPMFLLFLGDREQLPAFSTHVSGENHITDLYYATAIGSDYIPDCYYGRLSATNNKELSNQIEKIMMYEQYSMPDPSYLGNAVLIAGTDANYGPTHGNGQINYIKNNYIKTDNPDHNYTNVMAHMYNCSSQASEIRSEVSAGAGLVNYTAHGSETSWSNPSFTTSHVSQLQNTDKYGLMIGNCCLSGAFSTGVCFGEALLRAEKKGAMGYIGASNSSYWGEDYYWAVGVRNNITSNPTYNANVLGAYDKLFHQHNENYSYWVSTIGGMITAGNATVQSSSSSLKQYYWEIYHCFGDPSVRIYLGIPEAMQVTAAQAIRADCSEYEVSTLTPYAYVALTRNNEHFVSAFADEYGDVTFDFTDNLEIGDYELVVLAQNKIPYFMNVQVISPHGPYVVPVAVEAAENTRFLEGGTVQLDLRVANIGLGAASDVYALLIPQEPITMLQDSIYIGDVSDTSTESLYNAFSFEMPMAHDNTRLPFTLAIHWTDTIITRDMQILVVKPLVKLEEYTTSVNNVTASVFGPGDEISFEFKNLNVGHAAVENGFVDLTCNYSGVKVNTPSSSIDGLSPNEFSTNDFLVSIADTVPSASRVNLYYHTVYGDVNRIDTITIMVGGLNEGFESGDFSNQSWLMGNHPWVITSSDKHSGSYAARSAEDLPNNSKSRMTISTSTTQPSTISYYRKVSSEAGFDKFFLYINNSKFDEASGEEDWQQVVVNVSSGNNTIVFSYEKDYMTVSGEDCTYIDDIVLPCDGIAVIEDVEDVVGVHAYTEVRTAVYPNPATLWVNVESEEPVGKVVLFDINGRVVKMMNAEGETRCQVSMNDVPEGLYLLQVAYGDNQVRTFKVIKK